MTEIRELEAGIIGTVLLAPSSLDTVRADAHLKPEHFSNARLAKAFDALCGLRDRGESFDDAILRAELARLGDPDPQQLVGFAATSAHGADIRDYATRVINAAEWRRRTIVLERLAAASTSQDQQAWGTALAELDRDDHRKRGLTPDEWGALLNSVIDPDRDVPPAIPLPWPPLNTALDGGIWPGDYLVLAGWTNHGKSICADMILDAAAEKDRSVHLYLAEMTPAERGRRLLTRHTGVPTARLKTRDYNPGDLDKVVRVTGRMPYGCTNVADWTIDEVCADIRRAGWDLAVIDGMHDFPYEDERDLNRISRTIYKTAKATGTAIVALAHLNEKMAPSSGVQRPRPALHAIKGASAIKQQADVVGFVWQQDDDLGQPSGEGAIWWAKSRNSGVGATDVALDKYLRLVA